MSNKETLLELALRCEQATKGDPQLDALIRCAVFAPPEAVVQQSPINGAWCIYVAGRDGRSRLWEAIGLSQLQRRGEFTASTDAAMTLAPVGRRIDAIFDGSTNRVYVADPHVKSCASTPALALTAASLRALASHEDE